MGELKHTFRPEFLNRIDDIIVFHPLDEENIRSIVGIMLGSLSKRLTQSGIVLEIADEAKALLAKKGYDPVFGARPLRRSIQAMVEDKLAELMLEGKVKAGDKVAVNAKDEDLSFDITR